MRILIKLSIIITCLFGVFLHAQQTQLTVQYFFSGTTAQLSGEWDLLDANGNVIHANIPTDDPFPVDVGQNYKLRAQGEIGSNMGFLDWEDNQDNFIREFEYYCEDIIPDIRVAFFLDRHVIDISATDGIDIEIYDPWYVDPSGNQPNDFVPISQWNQASANWNPIVFNGRGDDIDFLEPPYYQIRAKRLVALNSSNPSIDDGIYQINSSDYFTHSTGIEMGNTDISADYYYTVPVIFSGNNMEFSTNYVNYNTLPVPTQNLHINILENEELIITAGSEITFSTDNYISVYGILRVAGTEFSPVILKADGEYNFGLHDLWKGIDVESNGGFQMEWGEIRYSQFGVRMHQSLFYSPPAFCIINNSHFENNMLDIIFSGGLNINAPVNEDPFIISNSTFIKNYSIHGLIVITNSKNTIVIKDSEFLINKGPYISANNFFGDLEISNNCFSIVGNWVTFPNINPAIYISGIPKLKITNNSILNNQDLYNQDPGSSNIGSIELVTPDVSGGITTYTLSEIEIKNNTMSKLYYGIKIGINPSEIPLDNNLFDFSFDIRNNIIDGEDDIGGDWVDPPAGVIVENYGLFSPSDFNVGYNLIYGYDDPYSDLALNNTINRAIY